MMLSTLLMVLVFGMFFYLMMKNGGGCCGGHDHGAKEGHGGHGSCDSNTNSDHGR